MTARLGISSEETAIAAANLAFYRALEARELSAMDVVWAQSEAASCVHPGWHRLDGWDEIRRSWQNIFASARAWTVACEDVRIYVSGDFGWVSCVEVMSPFGDTSGESAARMQATNLFVKEEGDWKLLHHHASQSPEPDDDEEEETVN
jgi:ketosteroid isomerase-like protein